MWGGVDVTTLVTTAEAARLAGVAPATIRTWRTRGLLRPRGMRGRSVLHDPREVLLAERATRTGVVAHHVDLVAYSA